MKNIFKQVLSVLLNNGYLIDGSGKYIILNSSYFILNKFITGVFFFFEGFMGYKGCH